MKILFKQGSFEILTDDVTALEPHKMNWLIKRCGSISHQSWKTSKKTPEEFIQMIWRIKHLSVLEHSWFCFSIKINKTNSGDHILLDLLRANHLFCITERKKEVFVSGNARMFTEAYIRYPSHIIATLLDRLHKQNHVLFPLTPHKDLMIALHYVQSPCFYTNKERLIHQAMTVIFKDCSRGLTHEDVRSRNGHNKAVAYTQESTRYVDPTKKDGYKFILPYRKIDLSQKILVGNTEISIKDSIKRMKDIYTSLIKLGLQPQEARQWLPIGIKSEIVQTFNLAEWKHWFLIRTQKAAAPEIRFVACNFLKKVQKKFLNFLMNFIS